jgi:hypothetical protein
MKNPVRFSNNEEQTLFVFKEDDNCLLQVACILSHETTVVNIPHGSHISVKRGHSIGGFIVPSETIFETSISHNYVIFNIS